MNREQRRREAAEERPSRKKDARAYRDACVLLQRERGMSLDKACQVLREIDRESLETFTGEEADAVMIVVSAWRGGVISPEVAESLIGREAMK